MKEIREQLKIEEDIAISNFNLNTLGFTAKRYSHHEFIISDKTTQILSIYRHPNETNWYWIDTMNINHIMWPYYFNLAFKANEELSDVFNSLIKFVEEFRVHFV